ncbi:uncharacterized protein LOC130591513 [Beta vulgaris subsp. vulgaris]|uniref:uncharacterized protein LOC130591513 n=1 Tax=Beta vulgaris subsp. vulgaris TaxID=3555 RepID=UPI0025494F48|nr:uncharacterized protein LOC130591513 [Beta vulgaris subsp. vulgaris]
MHGVDAKGQRIIPDPGTKQIANAIIGLKEKEAAGEFTPRGQVDALHETLGRDQYGRVRGVGGVRLGVRKVYGDQYTSTSRSTTSSVNSSPSIDVEAMKAELREELRAEMTQNFNAILAQMGLPTFGAFTQGNVPMQPVPTQPVPTQPRPQPELTEETPCELCNQGDGHGRFIIVAYGSVQPPRDRPLLHNQPVADIHYVVSVEDIVPVSKHFLFRCRMQELVYSYCLIPLAVIFYGRVHWCG